jgi:uncharacterized protein YdeI (YjbR/CyaY-like superfamily)
MSSREMGETVRVNSRREWRGWLERHHAERREIWLLSYRKSTGRQTVAYEEAVREALCFGWVDGLERGYDEDSFALRFTPRRPRSNWSESNRARVRELLVAGLMTEAGRAVLPPDLTDL